MATMHIPEYPKPTFDTAQQTPPGKTNAMTPRPDHGETTYRGSDRLAGKVAIITGADSGIGRAVAIAYAREGADLVLSYLDEHDDAQETEKWVKEAGREAVLIPGDISDPAHAESIVKQAMVQFGRLDVLVNNAAYQNPVDEIEDITVEDWNRHYAVNIHAMFYLVKAAVPHMKAGASIINTTSINADQPNAHLLAYATTKGAIQNFTMGLAQLLAEQEIRVNCVAPGPIWTPLIPSTMPPEAVKSFGENTPLGRAGQPRELAPAYVMLASDESSYTAGATVAVTGGRPFI